MKMMDQWKMLFYAGSWKNWVSSLWGKIVKGKICDHFQMHKDYFIEIEGHLLPQRREQGDEDTPSCSPGLSGRRLS